MGLCGEIQHDQLTSVARAKSDANTRQSEAVFATNTDIMTRISEESSPSSYENGCRSSAVRQNRRAVHATSRQIQIGCTCIMMHEQVGQPQTTRAEFPSTSFGAC